MSPPYTTPHYVLMVLSVAIFVFFVGGIIYLLIREKHKVVLAKKEHIQALLRRRRQAFSAAPRSPPPPSPPGITHLPQVQITTSFYSYPSRTMIPVSQLFEKDSIAPL
ncbi:hypothetical protein EGW08_001412 [Elysia chlorotica]|uniref:Uncharacterized protein n=1 Tax=Elysia chlorotica TaxID=188477 RepID=A0A433UAE9_ELYCH|nr:hypothetical protein EGW08_001412 [Elysia chlorotica]